MFVTVVYFIMSMISITSILAKENVPKEKQMISKYEVDVTGDGTKDNVIVKGKLMEKTAQFYEELVVEIYTEDEEDANDVYTIELESGYRPTITFNDITGDKIADMYISVPITDSGDITQQHLYTMAASKLTDLAIPQPLTVNSQLNNDLTASISVADNKKTYKLDLSHRKQIYEQAGLYHNGKLNAPTELIIDPHGSHQIIPIDHEQYGLLSIYNVSDVTEDGIVAQLVTTWEWTKGEWVLSNCSMKDFNQGNLMKRKIN